MHVIFSNAAYTFKIYAWPVLVGTKLWSSEILGIVAEIWINTLFCSSAAACTIRYPFVARFLHGPAIQQRIKTQLLWPCALTVLWSLLNPYNGNSNCGLNWKGCACSLLDRTYSLSVIPFWEENYKLLMAGFLRLRDFALPSSVKHVISRRGCPGSPVQMRAAWELRRSSSPSQQLFFLCKSHQSLEVYARGRERETGEEQEGYKSMLLPSSLKTLR